MLIDIDRLGRRHLGEPRHGHDVSGDGHHESAGKGPDDIAENGAGQGIDQPGEQAAANEYMNGTQWRL